MKVIRPRETVQSLDAGDLVRYALSLDDFHLANIGMDSMEAVQSNLEILRNFSPLDEEKMNEVRLALQPFFRGENVAWMQPGYRDGWGSGIHLA